MKKSVVKIISITCVLISLFGCKSNEQKAQEDMDAHEYKKAYELLCQLEDTNKSDDCLYEWCKYCIEQDIVDDDLNGLKITSNEYSLKVFNIIKDSYQIDKRLSQQQCDVAILVMSIIENNYKDDSEYLSLKSKIHTDLKYWQDDEKIADLQSKGMYKEAYEYAYLLDEDHQRGYSALVQWYNYCIGDECLDDGLLKIDIENNDIAGKVYNILVSYLKNKVSPNKEQCQFALKILDKIDEHLTSSQKDHDVVKTTLQDWINDEYIWNIPQQKSVLSYDQYYSTLHYYSKDDLNKTVEDSYLLPTQLGYKLMVTDNDTLKQQYVLFGIYKADQHRLLNDGSFDGYWIYYTDISEPAVYRVDINGKVEQLLSNEDLNVAVVYNGFVLDSDVLYAYAKVSDDVIRIYRVYLADKTVDKWEINVNIVYSSFTLLVPKDSDHLLFHYDNLDYINKLEEYKSDKEGLYNLIDKYYDINKSEYDSYNFEQIIASYGLMIQSSIEKEYGILPYCYYEYDVKNSNIVAIATSDTYENIYK